MQRNLWSWVGLGILLLAGVLLVATAPAVPAPDAVPAEPRHALIKALGLFALIGVGLALGTQGRGEIALKQLLCWGAAGLALAVVLTYRTPLQEFFGRFGALRATEEPARSAPSGTEPATVSLRAEANGHFIADALVNGTHVSFIVDTGATDVVLRRVDAARLGIDLKALNYAVPAHTANGETLIALVDIDEIAIGAIRVERVTASVPLNELNHSLLGMSFLKRLSSFAVDSDRLVMRQ
jgi:aspartyl protease family protein